MTDGFYPALIGLVALLTVNRLVLPRFVLNPWVFWPFVAVDLVAIALVAWFGFPGIEDEVVARWIVAAMLAVHVVSNLSRRDRARWERDREAAEAERRRATSPPPRR